VVIGVLFVLAALGFAVCAAALVLSGWRNRGDLRAAYCEHRHWIKPLFILCVAATTVELILAYT
jgi:hypothetical protein